MPFACLARKCVCDGEKVTKFVQVRVAGAPDDLAAEKVARAVANSLLVKSSWYGSDPNWGRVVDAAGYAKIGLDIDKLDMHYDEVPALIKGEPVQENKGKWKEIVSGKQFLIGLDLNLGSGACEIWSNDLSERCVISTRASDGQGRGKQTESAFCRGSSFVRAFADPFSWSSTGEVSWTRPIPK